MADDVMLPLGEPEDAPPPSPVLTDEPLDAAPVDEPAAEEAPEAPPPAPEAPMLSREQQLAAENAALRQWATLLEQQTRQGQQAPSVPQAPDFFANMTPEQKAAWNASYQTLAPALEYRERQLRQQVEQQFEQRLAAMEQRYSEAAQLRATTPDFAQREAELVTMQQQAARQGQYFSLGQLYTFVKGQEAIQAAQRTSTPRTQQTQQRRRAVATGARPETTAPTAVRVPAPPVSADRIKAMSDDEFLERMAAQAGIPRLKMTKRAS